MHSKIVKTTLILIGLVTTSVASADQDFSVAPQTGSDLILQQNDKLPGQRSDRRIGNRAQPSFRRPVLQPYIAGGYGRGGDTIGSFTDNFGDTDRVRSGGGGFIEGGVVATIDNATTLRLTAGYESDQTDSFNGIASFDRTRFDLVVLRSFGAFEVGGGVTGQVNINFECDILTICGVSQDFDNAVGYTLEAAFTSRNWRGRSGVQSRRRLATRIGLRYTGIDYDPDSVANATISDASIDGDALSFFIGISI